MEQVKIVEFDSQGNALGQKEVEKVVLESSEWRERLSPGQYYVTRQAGTEKPFTGPLNDYKGDGILLCVGCGLPLFRGSDKFESGTGWPSFTRAIAPQNIAEHRDSTLGMERVEVLCKRCDAHLGHVFPDGPEPAGMRYCMNSAALKVQE